MTSWETRSEVLGLCPCGQGHAVLDIETPEDSGYGRAQVTERISCTDCKAKYKLWGRGPSPFFTSYSEETEKRRLGDEAHNLGGPIRLQLLRSLEQTIKKSGKTMTHWHPLAVSLVGAPEDLDVFRKDIRARGSFSNWLNCNVHSAQYAGLASAMGRQDLVPALGAFSAADQVAKSYVVRRIPVEAVLPKR